MEEESTINFNGAAATAKRRRDRLSSSAVLALTAMSGAIMGSMGGLMSDLGGMGRLGGLCEYAPQRRTNNHRRGPCTQCGKKNVRAGRERGTYLCQQCLMADAATAMAEATMESKQNE